jgi:hypothetical protein
MACGAEGTAGIRTFDLVKGPGSGWQSPSALPRLLRGLVALADSARPPRRTRARAADTTHPHPLHTTDEVCTHAGFGTSSAGYVDAMRAARITGAGQKRQVSLLAARLLAVSALILAAWIVLAVVVEAREPHNKSPTPQIQPLPHTALGRP